MFQVTRLAVKITNTARSTVKNVAKNKINLQHATDSFKKTANEAVEQSPFSKNIFKRAITWVKEFAANFKVIKQGLKDTLNNGKKTLGNAYEKDNNKQWLTKQYFKTLKTHIDNIKNELNRLKETGKKAAVTKK